jgi:two-component system phosphate regulon sensor histidine kinase PhoR
LGEHGLSFANPVLDGSALSLGILFGKRNDGSDPLDRGEFELVQTLCLQAAAVIEHLRLMEKMILEQRKRREIEELSRLKSHFVSSVSHDLRTPLTSMSMFLELLDTPRLPAKDRNEYIGLIRQEAERLRRLVENVLDFARAERGIKEFTLESVELSPLLRQAADAMSGRFKAVGAVYTTRIPARLPRVLADAQALERAFVNLLSNAYKYTPQKKKVSFTVRKRDSTIQIDIADNGFGIAEDELPNIFDPFYRVRDAATSSTGGVGLGLSLVKRTIEQHNGHISVRSRKGKGTTVTVELPIHQSKG